MIPPLVLYAEDDYSHRKLLEIHLSRGGFSCDTVENGELALTQFRKKTYDVVILDLNMPGKNGLDVVKTLRAQGAKTPVFALTSDDSDSDALIQAGFDEVLIKPVLDNSLITLIKQYL